MKRVSYIFPTSHHYRRPFHERLRELLAAHDVDYRVVYSPPGLENIAKKDTVDIDWGIKVPTTRLGGIKYQHGMREAIKSDLVIVQQENSLALNYLLNIASLVKLKRVAYFGHGRNFQSRNPDGLAETWKRFWATKVDWWFGYTDETRRHIQKLGFPPEKITVFNNAVDTSEVKLSIEAVTSQDLENRRKQWGLEGSCVGVFVGGLYAEKRLDFLICAAEKVKNRMPGFEIVIIGGGDDLPLLTKLAEGKPWIKVTGPKFGSEKIELMMLGSLFLMPGLVGLAILDAGATGLPTVTTAFPWHSPEVAYLNNGVNGVIVKEWEDPDAYAEEVVALLQDKERLSLLQMAVKKTAEERTIEAMAKLFSEGVLKALA